MTIRVIDIETSGIEPSSEILEIASVDIAPPDAIKNVTQTLVRPKNPIPAEASAVHHMIDADFAGAPELKDVIGQFRQGEKLFYVAHNAKFEKGFLDPLLMSSEGETPTWVCTYKCALRAWPELPKHSNQFLRYHFGIVTPFNYSREQLQAHRALPDAIVTGAIFLKLMGEMKWGDMLRYSAEPALYTKFHFGKYVGQRYDAVDPSYLSWIVEKSDLEADVKHSAEHWLSQGKQAA